MFFSFFLNYDITTELTNVIYNLTILDQLSRSNIVN